MRRTIIGFLAGTAALLLLPMAGTLVAAGSTLGALLAQARAATAQYHDVDNATADGYQDMGPKPAEGAGSDFVNLGLVDCSLDLTHPESLRYLQTESGFRLVGVEYVIPMACPDAPPEDFLAGAGEWEPEPGVPAWTKLVWLWSGSSLDEEP